MIRLIPPSGLGEFGGRSVWQRRQTLIQRGRFRVQITEFSDESDVDQEPELITEPQFAFENLSSTTELCLTQKPSKKRRRDIEATGPRKKRRLHAPPPVVKTAKVLGDKKPKQLVKHFRVNNEWLSTIVEDDSGSFENTPLTSVETSPETSPRESMLSMPRTTPHSIDFFAELLMEDLDDVESPE